MIDPATGKVYHAGPPTPRLQRLTEEFLTAGRQFAEEIKDLCAGFYYSVTGKQRPVGEPSPGIIMMLDLEKELYGSKATSQEEHIAPDAPKPEDTF